MPFSCRSFVMVVTTGSHDNELPKTSVALTVSVADLVSSILVAVTASAAFEGAVNAGITTLKLMLVTIVSDAMPPPVSWNVIVPWNGGP